jgi:hypothetical protein
VQAFLRGERVLYAAPVEDQVQSFWYAVKNALYNPIEKGIYRKNEVYHTIELEGTKQRIRAKTAYNVDTMRGDYASLLILDEFHLMDNEVWNTVGAPMLADTNGSAIFVYTPPSLHSRSMTKARDPLHASKLFKKAEADTTGRWATFHFTSFDNPHISHEALDEISGDMSAISYRQEILAEDVEEAPDALWARKLINDTRVQEHPDLVRIVVGVDPTGSQQNECGIIVAGLGIDGDGYIIDDKSLLGSPGEWADEVLNAYIINNADIIVGETNYGGDMVEATIEQAANTKNLIYRYKNVRATRGKAVRAEPIVAAYEHGRVHHVGEFPFLEEEMVMWIPGLSHYSDALVWAMTELNVKPPPPTQPSMMFTDLRSQVSRKY